VGLWRRIGQKFGEALVQGLKKGMKEGCQTCADAARALDRLSVDTQLHDPSETEDEL